MTTEQLIDGLMRTEGGFSDDPDDRGGATRYGITAVTLGEWLKLGRPATREEVQGMPDETARAIYRSWYLGPFAWVLDEHLQAQLGDFGVNSGVVTAVRQLQLLLGVPADGIAGPTTKDAVAKQNAPLLNNALVAARLTYLSAIVDHDATQGKFIHGWLRRAVSFGVKGIAV